MSHPLLARLEREFEVPLACRGDLSLLDMPRRALLVSRGDRRASPTTPWVLKIIEAVQQLASTGEVLVTGSHRITWGIALTACKAESGAAIVGCKAEPDAITVSLLPHRHLLVWPAAKLHPKGKIPFSDRLMGALADRATSIYLREHGNMAKVATEIFLRKCPIDAIPTSDEPAPARKPLRKSSILKLDAEGWDSLVHFTREPDGAWSGESPADYLNWLSSGANAYPRDAFATLCRILDEKRIRGGGRLMPGGVEMACFTAALPHDALATAVWRRGLRRWSFTPYGIAIRRDVLERMGARPVSYLKTDEIKKTSFGERLYQQVTTSAGIDWSLEKEWRVAGDVDLASIDRDAVRVLVSNEAEAAEIKRRFGLHATAIIT